MDQSAIFAWFSAHLTQNQLLSDEELYINMKELETEQARKKKSMKEEK